MSQEKFFGDDPGTEPEENPGRKLMGLLCDELIRRLTKNPEAMVASELEVVRKLLTDNSVTLANVRRGDFGAFAQRTAEELPFEDNGAPRLRAVQ